MSKQALSVGMWCFEPMTTQLKTKSNAKLFKHIYLFRGLSVATLRKLQCIQNSLARIVCRTTCLSHTTPLRKALHWLPIRHRCIFKTALLVYKYLHTNCPKYFSPFLKVRQCAYNTRLSQSDGIILHVPQYQPSIYKSTKQFGLSFAYDAPKIWNELPDDV